MRTQLYFILLCALAGLAGCHPPPASPPPAPPQPAIAPGEIGSRLPDFSVEGLLGRKISSADLQGKVLLIDFWATWCQPCKKEMPGYQKLQHRYGSQGFAVIGLKFDTMADTVDPIQFAKRIGVHYPLAVATDELKQKFGGIQGLPTTLLYDRHGVLRQKIIGFEYTSTIDSYLKPLLQEEKEQHDTTATAPAPVSPSKAPSHRTGSTRRAASLRVRKLILPKTGQPASPSTSLTPSIQRTYNFPLDNFQKWVYTCCVIRALLLAPPDKVWSSAE